MKVRFQADNDFNQRIIAMLLREEPAIDFQTAVSANLHGLSDLDVLALAAFEGRILVSHDQSTMPEAFAEFIAENISSGVLIVTQSLSFEIVVYELMTVWAASEAEEWINCITYIPL